MNKFRYSVIGLACLALASCSDPEKDANVVFVDAAGIVQGASNKSDWDKYQAYTSAVDKLSELQGDKFKGTQASLKLASSEKVGGLSLSELNAEVIRLSKSKAVCVATKNDSCLLDIIATPIAGLVEKRREEDADVAVKIVARLHVLGRHEEASATLRQIVVKVAGADALPQVASRYQMIMLPYLNEVKGRVSDDEMLAIYERVISVPALANSKSSIDSMNTEIVRSLSVTDYPKFLTRVLGATSDPGKRAEIGKRVGTSYYSNDARGPSIEVISGLLPLLHEKDRQEVIDNFAGLGSKQLKEALALPGVDAVQLQKMFLTKSSWRLASDERTAMLKDADQETLNTLANSVIRWGLEERSNRDQFAGIFSQLTGLKPITSEAMPILTDFLRGNDHLEDIIAVNAQRVAANPASNESHEFCESFPQMFVSAGRSDLLLSIVEACTPMYANEPGNMNASAISMMRSLVAAATKTDEQTLDAVLDKLKALPTWGRGVDYVTNQLWWSGKGAQIIAIADQLTPRSGVPADELRSIFYRALDKSFNVKDADPMKIWDQGLERVGFFHAQWIPTASDNRPEDAQAWKFLDRLITERPEQFLDYTKAVDDRWSMSMPTLYRLDTQRLFRLYNALPEGDAREGVLSVLAFKYRPGMGQEIEAAVWRLPEDPVKASFRVSDLKIGEIISGGKAASN